MIIVPPSFVNVEAVEPAIVKLLQSTAPDQEACPRNPASEPLPSFISSPTDKVSVLPCITRFPSLTQRVPVIDAEPSRTWLSPPDLFIVKSCILPEEPFTSNLASPPP